MKQIEREMKGEEADATDDEVNLTHALRPTQPDFNRKTFSRLLILTSHTTILKIVLAQSMPHVAEPMLKLTMSSKTT